MRTPHASHDSSMCCFFRKSGGCAQKLERRNASKKKPTAENWSKSARNFVPGGSWREMGCCAGLTGNVAPHHNTHVCRSSATACKE